MKGEDTKKQDRGKWPNIQTTEIFEAVSKSIYKTVIHSAKRKGPVGEEWGLK